MIHHEIRCSLKHTPEVTRVSSFSTHPPSPKAVTASETLPMAPSSSTISLTGSTHAGCPPGCDMKEFYSMTIGIMAAKAGSGVGKKKEGNKTP